MELTTTTEPVTGRDFDAAMMEDAERGGLWIRVAAFDNGGETVDRYSIVVEADPPWGQDDQHGPETFTYHASPHPFDPRGVGMTADGWAIADADVLVEFATLPEDVQRAVWGAAGRGWMLSTPNGYAEFSYDFTAERWVPRFARR